MDLSQCPYDGTAIEADMWSGGSMLVTCPACEAAWETHGAWIRRVREPDREKLMAVRLGAQRARR